MHEHEGELDRRQYRSVAELIKAVRLRHLVSQRELARRSGMAQAQLARYENGTQEPQLSTLRRLLEPLGWVPTFGLEPTTAVLDERFDAGLDPIGLLGVDGVIVLEMAALAAADGVGVAVGGEAAAVLQGVPVRTDDVVLHLRRRDLREFGRVARSKHRDVIRLDDGDDSWGVCFGGAVAPLRLGDVLPPCRAVPPDFAPWLAHLATPVVDLDELVATGALGPSALALAWRLSELECTESIP
jgi:transcriptional regulator with XRE-family HTH domain